MSAVAIVQTNIFMVATVQTHVHVVATMQHVLLVLVCLPSFPIVTLKTQGNQ